MNGVAAVALVVHHGRPLALDLARQAAGWLHEAGRKVWLTHPDAAAAGIPELGCREEELAGRADVAVSLGGDGTMLRTVDLVARAGVPVLGVNIGQLGYLTEVEPAGLRAALDRILSGEYGIEERMMLDVRAESAAGAVLAATSALNEAVLEKTPLGHTVRLLVAIDGELFTTYAADGLIIATPTGSTAYAFSARGPIVEPGHRAMLLTPVSPHMLFDRTLVLEPTTVVRLEVSGGRPAALLIDGRFTATLHDGDAVSCTAAAQPARLVVFADRDFHAILKAKFGLNDR